MIKGKVASLIAAAALVAGSVAVAAPAMADNSNSGNGCTATVKTPSKSGNYIHVAGSASCSASSYRSMNVQLWHYYDLLPAALVTTAYDSGTKTSYNVSKNVCDNGGTTTYYTNGALENSGGGILVNVGGSGTITLSHC
ncbi:hypothetical protein [Leifsonia shinshuensis]|uniref:Spore-associated protein A n=1 Tax=Leifsonia shinshuensis TaxID=150026 RepID=A0A7G6YHG5_9MICO|nr:hypothetical protein [Leifsonia shinshuensis]QNE36838.1 hypothetical protein F1C12_18080 [Leifsonia shinshuensis]QNE37930.1 hypothetical protein F1C12_21850 [Leifsonia shinshuensis]